MTKLHSNILSVCIRRVCHRMSAGTPAGVGTARVPPIYLKAGDRTACTVEGIGTLSNTVEALRVSS